MTIGDKIRWLSAWFIDNEASRVTVEFQDKGRIAANIFNLPVEAIAKITDALLAKAREAKKK